MDQKVNVKVKQQPIEDDDSDIEILEDETNPVQQMDDATQLNLSFREVDPSKWIFGFSKAGNRDSRIIVDEEDDQTLCRQFAKARGDTWFCVGCCQIDRKQAKTKGHFNGLIFEVPVLHSCAPVSKAAAMKEQEEIKKKHRITTPAVEPSSGLRKRTRTSARELDQSDLDHSTASTPTGAKKGPGRPKKAKIADESANHTASEDDTPSNEKNYSRTRADVAIQVPEIQMLSLYEILACNDYADVIITSSDGIEIPSYRILLSKYSAGFEKVFKESTELPIKIIDNEFNGETIKAVVDFCYGKTNAVEGKEPTIFKLAMKYDIPVLKEACVRHFKNSVNAENVCELIQIAYTNGFEDLKAKCLKVLVEKQKDIPSENVDALPGKILADALRYKAL